MQILILKENKKRKDEQLSQLFREMTIERLSDKIEEIADEMRRSPSSIKARLKKLNLLTNLL